MLRSLGPLMVRVFRHYVSAMILGLAVADAFVVATAAWLVQSSLEFWIADGDLAPKVAAVAVATGLTFYIADLYRTDLRLSHRELVARLIVALPVSALLTAAAGFAVPALRFGRLGFVAVFAAGSVGLVTWRLVWNAISANQRLAMRVLVLGVSRNANRLAELQKAGTHPFSILGFLDDAPGAADNLPDGTELLGKTRDLLNLADELQPDLVVVALPDMRGALPTGDLLECRLRGIRVEDWPTFYEKRTGKVLVTDLRPSWLIFADGFSKTEITRAIKRTLDIVMSFVGLVVTLPVMAAIAIAIRLDSPGSVLFRQRRVGQSGRIFTLNKFRSMRADAEASSGAVWASRDDPRVTRLGRILRTARLDELPQLVNVLVGDMSFVGPRPERPEFVRTLQRQIPYYMGRLAVKPGITGWAQVKYHYAASVEDTLEKLQYDLYYIKNLSPFLDVLILLSTIQVVLFARGSR